MGIYSICKHKPKFVPVGNKEVFLCGYSDIETRRVIRTISNLDVFIAMDSSWDNYQPKYPKNPIVQALYDKFHNGQDELDNLALIEVEDRGIHERLAKEVVSLFKKGFRIGFGCYGGHGRTGWLLGKLIKEVENIEGDKLIRTIRKRWCEEAVESKEQFKSLGVGHKGWIKEPMRLSNYSWMNRGMIEEMKGGEKNGEKEENEGSEVFMP